MKDNYKSILFGLFKLHVRFVKFIKILFKALMGCLIMVFLLAGVIKINFFNFEGFNVILWCFLCVYIIEKIIRK